MGQVQLTQRDPQFDDDGKKFQNIDVETLWINIWLVIILAIVPAHFSRDTSRYQIIDGDAPHVIEFRSWGPATQG
jgi:hypothetical protein